MCVCTEYILYGLCSMPFQYPTRTFHLTNKTSCVDENKSKCEGRESSARLVICWTTPSDTCQYLMFEFQRVSVYTREGGGGREGVEGDREGREEGGSGEGGREVRAVCQWRRGGGTSGGRDNYGPDMDLFSL